jgi:hypothetical protein
MILLFNAVCLADTITLIDGTTTAGTVARVVPGESVELFRIDPEEGTARIDVYPLVQVAEIAVAGASSILATIELVSGDTFEGTVLSSPLAPLIEFRSQSGTTYAFDAASVRAIRFALRAAGSEAVEEDTEPEELLPAVGIGLSLAAGAVGVTRDAIAYFDENWMLIAALGLHVTWSDDPVVGIGVSSDLTYLRKFGRVHLGIGTGVFFDMSEVEWRPTINVRVLVPFTWKDWQTTLSLGYVFRL